MQGDLLYVAVFAVLAALILVPSIWALKPRSDRLRDRSPVFGAGRTAGRGLS